MLPDELLARSLAIREAYHVLEREHHGSVWTVEEDLLALTNDIGNVARLAMTQQGRYYDETPYDLGSKLAENIWWLIEIAHRLDINIQEEMQTFLKEKEALLGLAENKRKT